MKTLFVSIILTLLISSPAVAQTSGSQSRNFDIPKGMKQYFIGFLVRGSKYTPNMPEEERAKLLQKHLAYIRSQAEAGNYKLAGPFTDDDRIAGMLIIDVRTAEEAKHIVEGDPMVQAGRLAVVIHPALLADVSCVLTEYEKNSRK